MAQRAPLIPIVVAVAAAGGTLWWVNTRPDVDPLGVGEEPSVGAPPPAAAPPAAGTHRAAIQPSAAPGELPKLLAAFREARGTQARLAAAHQIALRGKAAAPLQPDLTAELDTAASPEIRAKLAWVLGELGEAAALSALWRRALNDADAAARAAAVRAIVVLGDSGNAEALSAIDREAEPAARVAWAELLSHAARRAPAADSAVALRLAQLARDDPDWAVRARALEGIARLVRSTEGPIWGALEDRMLRDPDYRVRGTAALALISSRHPQARELVERAIEAESDERMRAGLREALANLPPGD